MIKERIQALQNLMKQNHIDIYIIPTSDDHQSEYVGDYFKCREYMSGFTGSAGTLIVTLNEARLWVDGRYYIQGEKQLQGSGIILMKMAMPNVETVHEFLQKDPSLTIGFDGKTMAYQQVRDLPNPIIDDLDLVGVIWQDRPTLSHEPAYLYDIQYCGETRESKLKRVRDMMGDCQHHLICSLDDIAWLLNIRGQDIHCNPVVNAYALINQTNAYLYVQDDVIKHDIANVLNADGIIIRSYDQIYEDVKNIDGTIMLDSQSVNYSLIKNLQNATIIDRCNPTQLFKAIKNETEIKATKNAHLKDGVAMTKFMYWLKKTIGTKELDEVDISNQLEQFRRQQEGFLDLSFDTICGYQDNAALMHYKAKKGECAKVTNKGMLLIDSGGQYIDGTTDITRTFILGPLSNEERRDFTIALKAMLRLQNTHFLAGTTGTNLDILARGIIYDYDLDYRCGTGHGVGHLLNVHEGPNSIRPRPLSGKNDAPLQPGMITTDEPGIYKEGKYGIRHENELLCIQCTNNEYGQFMKFEPITYVPFDISDLDDHVLSNHEMDALNNYQQFVYDKISPYLSDEEKQWYCQTLIIKK